MERPWGRGCFDDPGPADQPPVRPLDPDEQPHVADVDAFPRLHQQIDVETVDFGVGDLAKQQVDSSGHFPRRQIPRGAWMKRDADMVEPGIRERMQYILLE